MGYLVRNGIGYTGSGDILIPTNYSLEEQVVGTWIDGKPLYQKTVNFTLGSAGIYNTYDTGIDNVDIVVSAKGFYINEDIHFYELTPYTENSATVQTVQVQLFCTLISNRIRIDYRNGSSVANRPCYVTLQYTKTTD